MPKRNGEKEAYWRRMVRRQQQSGLTVRQFCREHGLSEPSFFSWRREIAHRDRRTSTPVPANGPGASSVEQAAGSQPVPSPFIPLRLAGEASSTIELVHPRGWMLRIPAVFDESALRKVLRLLDQTGGEA